MTLTRASRRLASLLRRRNELTHHLGAAVANAAESYIRGVWGEFLTFLGQSPTWTAAQAEVRQLFSSWIWDLPNVTEINLRRVAIWSWNGAVRDLGGAAITSFDDVLFSPPSSEDVNRIVFSNQWRERLAAATRLADPWTLGNIVAGGIAAGKSNQEIAKQILPVVNNVRSSARRIARTETVRVAGAMQMKAHEALGDLVIGFTLHSMKDKHTRTWHRARDGQQYFKIPGPGQKGLFQMPRPPEEPPDPSERPPGTPAIAFNCRCFLTPILRP